MVHCSTPPPKRQPESKPCSHDSLLMNDCLHLAIVRRLIWSYGYARLLAFRDLSVSWSISAGYSVFRVAQLGNQAGGRGGGKRQAKAKDKAAGQEHIEACTLALQDGPANHDDAAQS
jgi:hypothetical protein